MGKCRCASTPCARQSGLQRHLVPSPWQRQCGSLRQAGPPAHSRRPTPCTTARPASSLPAVAAPPRAAAATVRACRVLHGRRLASSRTQWNDCIKQQQQQRSIGKELDICQLVLVCASLWRVGLLRIYAASLATRKQSTDANAAFSAVGLDSPVGRADEAGTAFVGAVPTAGPLATPSWSMPGAACKPQCVVIPVHAHISSIWAVSILACCLGILWATALR